MSRWDIVPTYHHKETDRNGTVRYYNEKNELHREDGPAVEWASGSKAWWVNGKRHRLDGPAVEWADGTKHWYVNGKCHRLDGPAMEWANGSKYWYVNGKRHRTDGPAIERADGTKHWYVNGRGLTEEEFNQRFSQAHQAGLDLGSLGVMASEMGDEVDYDPTRQQYFKEEDKATPALDNMDFQQSYDTDLNLPDPDRFKKELPPNWEDRENLQLWTSLKFSTLKATSSLRLASPESYQDGSGIQMDKKEFDDQALQFHQEDHQDIHNQRDWMWGEVDYHDFNPTEPGFVPKLDEQVKNLENQPYKAMAGWHKVLSWDIVPTYHHKETDRNGTVRYYNEKNELHREDGPAIEGADGSKEWWVNGKLHREDGPAIEWYDGTKEWWVNGKPHRTDGPAVEWADGSKEWWVNGQELTEEEFNRRFPQAHHAGLDLRFADSRMGGGYNVTENWRYAFHVAPNDQEIHITDENNDEDWSNRTDDNDGAVPNLPPHVASVAETVIDGKRYWKVPPDVRKALSGSIAAAFGVRKHDGDMWVPFGCYEDLCEQTRDIIKEFSSLRLAWEVVPEVPSVGDQLYFKNDLSLTDKVGLAAMNEKYMGLPSVVENIWLNHTFGYGEPPYKGSVGTIQLVYEDNFGGAYLVPLSYWQEFLEYRDRTAGLKFSEVALPKGEQYDSYNLDTDIQPDETVQHSPTVRREKYDPVKYRLDWGSTNEEKFFEKGLHGGPDRKETERPLTPFGGLKLAWEVEERGSTAEDFYNSKIGDIWLLSRKDGKGKPKVFVVESVTYGGIHGYYGATIEAVLHYYEQKTRAFRFTASMDANYEDIVFQYLTSVDFEQTHAYIEAVDRGLDSYVDPHSKRLIKFAQEKPDITYPELDDVMTINKDVNDAFGTRHQVYDYTEGKVLGSIGRTQVGWGDWEKYPTIPEKAAVLAFDGVTGHWFVDGNHRTAFNLCLWFLHQNGCTLPEEKLEEFKQLIYQCGDQAPLTGNDQVDAAVAKEKRERDEAQMMEFMKQSVVPMDTNEIPEDIHEPT